MTFPTDEDKGSLGKVVKMEMKAFMKKPAARPLAEKNEDDLKTITRLFLECIYIHHDQVPKDLDPSEFRDVVLGTLPRRFDGKEKYLKMVPAAVRAYMTYLEGETELKDPAGFGKVLDEMEKKFEKAVKKVKEKDRIPKDDSAGQLKKTDGKVGRNDPCPCGSGKKYKKCCYPKVF
jgi:preprotein translocase subunit SecA